MTKTPMTMIAILNYHPLTRMSKITCFKASFSLQQDCRKNLVGLHFQTHPIIILLDRRLPFYPVISHYGRCYTSILFVQSIIISTIHCLNPRYFILTSAKSCEFELNPGIWWCPPVLSCFTINPLNVYIYIYI